MTNQQQQKKGLNFAKKFLHLLFCQKTVQLCHINCNVANLFTLPKRVEEEAESAIFPDIPPTHKNMADDNKYV